MKNFEKNLFSKLTHKDYVLIFESIFSIYQYDDIEVVEKGNNYGKIIEVAIEFCELVIKNPGAIIITSEMIMPFKDPRFFIPLQFLPKEALEKLLEILENIPINQLYKSTDMYETVQCDFEIDKNTRINIVKEFFIYLKETANNTKINTENKFEEDIIKKMLLKKINYIQKYIETKYF